MPKAAYERSLFGQVVAECCDVLDWTVAGDLARATGVNKASLWRIVPEGRPAGRLPRLSDANRERVVMTLMDAIEAAGFAPPRGLTRRDFLRLAGIVVVPAQSDISRGAPGFGHARADGQAAHLTFSPPGQRAATFDRLIELGDEASELMAHDQAEVAYRAALALTNVPAKQALATARLSRCAGNFNDAPGAQFYAIKALGLLAIRDAPPERNPSRKTLESRLRDEPALAAYAEVAATQGRLLRERGKLDEAEAVYGALETVGLLLDDNRIRADAAQFAGRVFIMRATKSAPIGQRMLRVVADGKAFLLDQAHDRLGQARNLRPRDDQLRVAYDWREETFAHALVDPRSRQAAEAAAASLEAFSKNPSRANVLIEIGRQAMALGNDAWAEEALRDAAFLGSLIGGVHLYVDALGALAELADLQARGRQRAIEYCLAAIVGWPAAIYPWDRDRQQRLLTRLAPTATEVERAAGASEFAFPLLLQLPGFDEARMRQGLRRLGYDISGDGHHAGAAVKARARAAAGG